MDYTRVLDARGELCPMPVIRSRLEMEDMAQGEVLRIMATDPGSKSDIPSWARVAGHELLEHSEEGGVFLFMIRKG